MQTTDNVIDKIKKIPVFYHIPKNAGTYVSDLMLLSFRYYRRTYTNWLRTYIPERDSIKCLQVIKDGFVVAKLLVGDPNSFCEHNLKFIKKHSKTEWDIQLEDILPEALTKVFLFGVIVEGRGFKINNLILNLLNDYIPHQFLILREPFSRAQSLYDYIKSERSIREHTHGIIEADTFEDYILSEQLEDSWIIRNLIQVENSIPLNEQHFNNAVDMLSRFNIYSIENTTQAVQEAFLTCYDFDILKVKLKNSDEVHKNEGKKDNKLQLENLSPKIQQTFTNRAFWDNKLYKTLMKVIHFK